MENKVGNRHGILRIGKTIWGSQQKSVLKEGTINILYFKDEREERKNAQLCVKKEAYAGSAS